MSRQAPKDRFAKAADWAGFSPDIHDADNWAPQAVVVRYLAVWKAYAFGDLHAADIGAAFGLSDKLVAKVKRRLAVYPGPKRARRYLDTDTLTSEQAQRLFAILRRETP